MIQCAIQSHPARASLAHALADRLAALHPVICEDPDPEAGPGPWRSFELCLQTASGRASHLLVIQDDAETCPGFTSAVRRIARVVGDAALVCLWHGEYPRTTALQVKRAAERGESLALITVAQWVPLVATLWPARLATQCLADVGTPPLAYADDNIIGRWTTRSRTRVLVSVPNLVEHPDTLPSLMGRRITQPRRSMCYTGDYPVGQVDWRLPTY